MCARRREIAFFLWPMSLDTEGRSRKKIAFGNPNANRRSHDANTTACARHLLSCQTGTSAVPAPYVGLKPREYGMWWTLTEYHYIAGASQRQPCHQRRDVSLRDYHRRRE